MAMTLADHLRSLRLRAGVSAGSMRSAARSTVHALERGRIMPSPAALVAMLAELEADDTARDVAWSLYRAQHEARQNHPERRGRGGRAC